MNIFYLSANQRECAMLHNDKHCVKMILEYAQLLSTAHRILDGVETTILTDKLKWKKVWKLKNELGVNLYSATHINHPSAIWVRQSTWNYVWLSRMLYELCVEYTFRYGKIHKVERDGLMEALLNTPVSIPLGVPFTEPPQCMPDEYKVDGNSIQAYKNYYIGDKQKLANWKVRGKPDWYVMGDTV